MAALPVGMQLVSALDDAAPSPASDDVRRALLLPLESAAMDVDMDIDVDIFRPSAMLDADGELFFGSTFQPGLGEAGEDIEQLLLCGSEEAALQSHHQHDTAPGQGCQCRNFAIRANRVQAQQERVAAALAAKDEKRVLRHTFGKRLQGFGFGEGAVRDQTQQQDVDECSLEMDVKQGLAAEIKQTASEPFGEIKTEAPATPQRVLHKSRSVEEDDMFSSPLHRSQSFSAVSSPLSTSFVSLESLMATPLSMTSRTTHPEKPAMMRSLSPADELDKMAASGSKTSMPKMNMLRGNFQVSPGHDTVPLVKPTAMLPPPYFRGALDSPRSAAHTPRLSTRLLSRCRFHFQTTR